SVYGRSKLAGERAVREAGSAHLVVRTSWVYGAQGTNFMRTIIRLAGERDALHVVSDQFGAPTSARTIGLTLADILQQGEADLETAFARSRGLVHLTNSGSPSWHGFASAILQALRARGMSLKATEVVAISGKDYPPLAARPANSRLDLARLKEAF